MKIETQYIKKPKKVSAVQWFVECGNSLSNESVTAMLSDYGMSDAESKCVGILGNDNRPHNVFRIPSHFVTMLRAAKRGDTRFKFRFFKRNGQEGMIYAADFLEKPRTSKKLQETKRKLASLKRSQKK